VKAVADTLGVARSHLIERLGEGKPAPRSRYSKADDAWLLPVIRTLTDGRPTYGYRRVCTLLNARLSSEGKAPVNHKRIYRIMRQNGLLLARHTGKRPHQLHEGRIITLHRNTRWCSDIFEIPCWNAEVVRVAFSLDCCDREVIGHIGTTGGISGEMIRDLMVDSVERRFGNLERLPRPIQWLSDNGSAYTAHETVALAQSLGLAPCTTPVRSPESNGMAEAFVKTFKRDYVFVHDRPNARAVLIQLAQWFDDYNENAPHRGLRMKSPRQFIRSQLATASCPV
jgi:putative transposase